MREICPLPAPRRRGRASAVSAQVRSASIAIPGLTRESHAGCGRWPTRSPDQVRGPIKSGDGHDEFGDDPIRRSPARIYPRPLPERCDGEVDLAHVTSADAGGAQMRRERGRSWLCAPSDLFSAPHDGGGRVTSSIIRRSDPCALPYRRLAADNRSPRRWRRRGRGGHRLRRRRGRRRLDASRKERPRNQKGNHHCFG